MTDDVSTPPIGIVGLKRAATRHQQQLTASPVATLPGGSPTATSSDSCLVAVADDPTLWSDGEERGLTRLSPTSRLAALERLIDGDKSLAILCGHRQVAGIKRDIALARSMLGARITIVPLPLGPLGQFAMARIAQQALRSLDRPPALIISHLPELANSLVDIGLVGAVSSLDIPGIRLRHQLASYLPGSRIFAAQLTPVPTVRRIRANSPQPDSEFPAPNFGPLGRRLLHAGARAIPAGLEELWRVSGLVTQVTSKLPLADYWHDDQAGELVLLPDNPEQWVEDRVSPVVSEPCRWCGEPKPADVTDCVFCGHTPR